MDQAVESKTASPPNWLLGFPDGIPAQPFGDYIESCARKMTDWNEGVSRFLTERMGHNGATCMALAQCGSLPEALKIESTWLTATVENYLNESRRFMAFNDDIMALLLRQGRLAPPRSDSEGATDRMQ